ncbi:putative aarF domain-containing protein kinase [Citrus sinensis]|nr:putative aarF domain-containing protein kinase [Citrus sinensis]
MTLLLFASPPIPALPANQQLKIYGKPINHRHLKSSRVSATRDDVDAFTEKSSYLFKLSSTDADSIVEYDLRKIASVYRRKPLILLRRVFQVGTTFGWWFGSRFVDELMERSDQMFPVRAAELRKILVELGPAYVKIAQAVSSRPDLIPPSYLDELSLLQDQITPFSSEVAFNTIEQELGLPIDELFSEISPEPVAAASLGQVYQARLRQSGRVVAVKVQRPGVQAAISLDIFILHFIAGLIRKARKFNTDLQELDYKIEAKNGLKFRQLYGGIQDVLIPEMYVEQTTRKVLIMEWVEGQKLSEVKDLYLIEVGVYCSFNQLLEKGFYHADPHPGNLFRSYDGKLAYIDFGMMGEFKEELREGFIEACLHLVNRDFDALAKDFVTLGLLPPTAEKEAVTKALTGVFQNAVAKGVRNISFGDLLGNLGATILAVLEGIAISSNPNYKVLGSTYPYIARKVLTDSSPQLKSSLVALLYKEGVFRIDRLESLLTESLRARTEKALVKKQTEDTDSRLITKEILSFTLTEKGLDALGIATLDYFTSAVIPFAAPFSFSSLTEEDRINLTNLRRLLLLLSRVQSSKSASVEVKEGSIYKNQTTYSEEASLVFYQLASAQEVLPILSVIPELPPELQQEFLHLPADLAGRLISRAAARTIRRMFL